MQTYGYRYFICILIFCGYLLVYFQRLCPAVIALDIQAAFGVNETLLGVLASAYFYPYAIMQIPSGLLADAWGPRKSVSIFFLLAALGATLMGLTSDLTMAIVGRVMVGIGVSTLFVSNFKLFSEWFTPKQFVIMGGFFMATGGVGALISSAPLAWISNLIGWRMTLVAVGAVTLLMSLLIYCFVRNRPTDIGLSPLRPHDNMAINHNPTLWKGFKHVITSKRFWPLAIWAFFDTGISFALGGLWGGPFLIKVYSLSKTETGGVLSMYAASLIIGGPLMGWIANRFGRKIVFIGCSVLLTIVCGIFYFFTYQLNLFCLYILFFFIFLSGGPVGPVQAAASKELFPLAIAGTSIGTVNIFPFFGGAFFQVFVGALITRAESAGSTSALAGYHDMFTAYLIGAIISLIAACFVKETFGKLETAMN